MHRTSGRSRRVLLVLVAGLAVALTGGAVQSSPAAAPVTVVFGAEQEPPCLNGVLSGCNNTWTSWTVGMAYPGAYRQKPDFSWEPYMLDGDVKILSRKPFTLLYKIKQNAVWSDGRPITVDDFIFTTTTIMNPRNDVAARSGFDQIRRMVKVNAKTMRVVFKRPFAAYKQIWSGDVRRAPEARAPGT